MRRIEGLVAFGALLLASTAAFAGEEKPPLPPGALGEIVKRIPAQDAASAADISRELVKAGPEGVKTLVALLAEPGKTDDSKIRFAVHGLALYVARGGAEEERKMLSDSLLAALADEARPPLVKAFLIQQLRFCGAKEACEPLGKFLLDEKLCEDATQTLLSIKGEEAAAALRQALPQAKGGCRLTLIQALGILRDAKAAPEVAKSATDENREIRLAALFALGNLGDPAWTELLAKAAGVEPAYERSQATHSLLTHAQRLIEANKGADAEKVYRALFAGRTAPEDRHARCAALRGLAAALGAKAMDDLAAAMASDDLQLRSVAADAAASIPGEDVTRLWVERIKGASPALTVELLNILARRGDRAALPAAFNAIKDADAKVRQAAVLAVGAVGKKEAVPPLLTVIAGQDDALRQTARVALIRIPGDETSAALASALPVLPKEVRATALGILAARGAQSHLDAILTCIQDKDEGVRVAALEAVGALADEKAIPQLLDVLLKTQSDRERGAAEKAVEMLARRSPARDKAAETLLAALPNAELDARCALLRVLGGTGSAKALDPLRAALKDTTPKVQDAGVRALAKWPNASVAPDLLAVAKGSEKGTLRTLAIRGYLDLLRQPNKRTPEESLRLYQDGMGVATNNDEKKAILGALRDVKAVGALKLAVPCLDVEALRPEAEAAVLGLAEQLRDTKELGARLEFQDALKKVAETAELGVVDQLRGVGFTDLFRPSGLRDTLQKAVENAKRHAAVAKEARRRLDWFKK
jgi:HEAT repeat protein